MKVIEEKPFEYDFECRQCQSRLVADENDVLYGDFGSAAFDTTNLQFFVTCPVCETDTIVQRNLVPPKVQKLAMAKGTK